ncbi:MBL fold metallo-hydrolase [Maritimibacter sp. DP4N28-5]|uniref:MBL fold metallo-hydrolase n=1 Tax=Maritimibacter dapengensis TaxID=2836868 RepID=A0ABS6SZX1_9RHOB|nr:MBL fold metallo-hydrolase [Maritimibacter dapengensis]
MGTAGGPILQPGRSQPAHLLTSGSQNILIDCGEGALGQLTRAGVGFRELEAVILTHHHFDHIGSLFALLGLSMMTQRRDPLRIYGPAGTQKIVASLIDACDVPNEIGFGVPGQKLPHARDFTVVQEIAPGDEVMIGEVRMTCCENTHYRGEDQHGQGGYLSLSLRFDTPDRSILVTGDTGSCRAVEALGQGVDLFVGELMDVEQTMEKVRAANPDMPVDRIQMIGSHLAEHHLRPEQLGEMAARSGAGELVAIHFSPGMVTPESAPDYSARIKAVFGGAVHLSEDLARY